MTWLTVLVVVLVFASFVPAMLQSHRLFALKLFLGQAVVLASVWFVERGAYLYEVDASSSETGATLRLLAYSVILLVGLILGSEARWAALRSRPLLTVAGGLRALTIPGMLAAGAFVVVAYGVNLLLSDSIPLVSGVSRFDFWPQVAAFPQLQAVFGEIGIVATMSLGYVLMAARRRRTKVVVAAIAALHAVVLAGMGHKFGAFLEMAFFLALPTLSMLTTRQVLRAGLRLTPVIALFAALTLALVFHQYARYSLAQEFGGPLQFAVYRASILQGQVWWITDAAMVRGELGAVDHPSQDAVIDGMVAVMRAFGRPGIEASIARGVRFSMGFPATAVYAFGPYAAMVIAALAGMWVGWCTASIYGALRQRRPVAFIGWSYMLIWATNFASQGSLNVLLDPKVALVGGVLVLSSLLFPGVGRAETAHVPAPQAAS